MKNTRKALEKELVEETDPDQVALIIKKLKAIDRKRSKKS